MGIVKPRDDNGVPLDPSRFQSLNNTTALGSNATYTQAWIDSTATGFLYPAGSVYGPGTSGPQDVNFVSGSVYADQAGTLYIDQSDDQTHYQTVAIPVSTATFTQIPLQQLTSRYYRFRYTNGATGQTIFELSQISERIDAFSIITPQAGGTSAATNTAAANTAVTVTINGQAGKNIYIWGIKAGYTGGAATQNLTVQDNGATVENNVVVNSLVDNRSNPLKISTGNNAVITLPAGGTSITGFVTVEYEIR